MICSDRTWGKYGYGTVLQLIIQLIYSKFIGIYVTVKARSLVNPRFYRYILARAVVRW